MKKLAITGFILGIWSLIFTLWIKFYLTALPDGFIGILILILFSVTAIAFFIGIIMDFLVFLKNKKGKLLAGLGVLISIITILILFFIQQYK